MPLITGLIPLDAIIGNFPSPGLTLIASRPADGKTSFMATMVGNARGAAPLAIFSLDMSAGELSNRLLSLSPRVNLAVSHIHTAGTALGRIVPITEFPSSSPVYILDDYRAPVTNILAHARALVRNHGIRAIFLDYLNLLGPSTSGQSRDASLVSHVLTLKSLSHDLSIPVILLGQLDRAVIPPGQPVPAPTLASIRGGATIADACDLVIFLRRCEPVPIDPPLDPLAPSTPIPFTALVLKNTNGPTGPASLTYLPARGFQ